MKNGKKASNSEAVPTLVLRGYAKCVGPDEWVAVCLTVNLVTTGKTAKESLNRLGTLIDAYLTDAAEAGELDKWYPRRAPLPFYVEYFKGKCLLTLHRAKHPFKIFSEAIAVPQHA